MVSVVSQDGQTALIFAVQEHHTETVKMLLAVGADVNLQEKVKEIKAICVDVDACTHSPFSVSTKHFSMLFCRTSVSQILSVYHTHSKFLT